jgi:hypothetical protein
MMIRNSISIVNLVLLISAFALADVMAADEEGVDQSEDVIELEGATIGRFGVPVESGDTDFSEAETVLWMTDQLGNVTKPSRLEYSFKRSGTMGDGFSDSIQLDVTRIKEDGMRSARVNFFTGERHQYVPPNENTNGNPVLSIYLQGDVYEMNRLTEGNWRYFHGRIKSAFAENAQVSDIEVNFDGVSAPAKKVLITPYVDDPRRPQFEQYADKTYEFIVSDQVPGYLYSIRTIIPGEDPLNGPPLIEEQLTLVSVVDLE